MRKAMLAIMVLVGLTAWHTPRAEADVKLHGLFTDNMVLQRDMKVPIWGTADPGEQVTVSLSFVATTSTVRAPVVAAADKEGRWVVTLPARPALETSGAGVLTVRGKSNTIELKNVMVGEVWIASGQSNMEWSLNQTRDPKEVIANSKNPKLRLFDVPKTPKPTPQTELGTMDEKKKAPGNRTFGKWMEADPSSVPGFSAVGYY